MRILLVGGTRFLGPPVVRQLTAAGHAVAVFHRGQSHADLPASVVRILGDRKDLKASAGEFKRFAPEVILDLIAYAESEALASVQTFRGLAQRLVVVSSMDVYRAYDRLRRVDPGPPDPVPLREDAPLRQCLYPYRAHAKAEDDFAYHYEKILVERAVRSQPDLPVTVLRLPCLYGLGDYQHRVFEHLKRMDDRRRAILLDTGRAGWRWTRGYVENVAAAIALAACDERSAGRIYNVGEQEALTESEWVRQIARAAAWDGEVAVLPPEQLPAHLQTPFDWRHDLVGDTSRIRQELGYEEPVSREEAIASAVAWERSHPPSAIDSRLFDYAAEDRALANLTSPLACKNEGTCLSLSR